MKVLPAAVLLATLTVASSARADPPGPLLAPLPPAPDPAAARARDAFLAEQRSAMGMLSGWAATSILTGGALLATGGDAYTRAIGIQNIAWGAVDGIIAGLAYRGMARQSSLEKPVSYWAEERRKMRNLFLINAGLDVLYIAAGATLAGLGKTDTLRGSGAGVVLQGSFLFVFDAASGFSLR
jgi:hypothetical protein